MNDDKPTLEVVVEVLLKRTTCRGDLLNCLPYDRRDSLAFIKQHHAELEAATGRKITIQPAEYIPSGRGAFGRLSAGRRAITLSAGVFWTP